MEHARSDYNGIQDASGKIPEDEPVFLLRATDETAPKIVRQWAYELLKTGGDKKMAERAVAWSWKMDAYQRKNGCKVADCDPKFLEGEVEQLCHPVKVYLKSGNVVEFRGRYVRELETDNWHYWLDEYGEIQHFRKENIEGVSGGSYMDVVNSRLQDSRPEAESQEDEIVAGSSEFDPDKFKPTHTGMVVNSPDLACKRERVGVIWKLRKTDKYWVGQGGVHFDLQTGKPMADVHDHQLDLTSISRV